MEYLQYQLHVSASTMAIVRFVFNSLSNYTISVVYSGGTGTRSRLQKGVIIQRFQSKLLRAIVNAPRYITNAMIHSDLGIPTIQDVIHKRNNKHGAKLQSHPNPLLQSLSRNNIPRRLKRSWPTDL